MYFCKWANIAFLNAVWNLIVLAVLAASGLSKGIPLCYKALSKDLFSAAEEADALLSLRCTKPLIDYCFFGGGLASSLTSSFSEHDSLDDRVSS
jgi:hypothetical protein